MRGLPQFSLALLRKEKSQHLTYGGCTMQWSWLLVIIMVLSASVSEAWDITVKYTEPAQTLGGAVLANLKETVIYYKQDATVEKSVIVPATKAAGGGVITKVITVAEPPQCGKSTVLVAAEARNTATPQGISPRTAAVSVAKDISTTAACIGPRTPSGLTVTTTP